MDISNIFCIFVLNNETMKTKVLSNIIDFLTTNDINQVDHYDYAMQNESINSGYMIDDTPMDMIWVDIYRNLRFDEISLHLLENLNDALDSEDYMSAALMRIEILNRWECSSEDDFWEIGRTYLFDLKQGLEKSKILGYLLETVKELEHLWLTRKYKYLDYIIEELSIVSSNISNQCPDDIANETITFIENDMVKHPLLSIENTIVFFKLLKE